MKSYKQFTEGTIQSNGTDKIDPACVEVAPKKKTNKEMQDEQQNESFTFDSAAMAKQELADAKNKKHRKRGKVANLLRKLGMKEEVESLDETGGPLGYMSSSDARKREAARRKKQLQSNETPAQKKFLDKATKLNKEEIELNEANHREFAQQGKMHPDMAKHMKAGQECDFYHCKTGDKISGVVKHKSDSEVHIKAHKDGKMGAGEMHKFSIATKLDEMRNRDDAYTRDYKSSVSGMGKHQSAAYRADGGANDEGWGDEHHSRSSYKPRSTMDRPHTVHIGGKPWKKFSNGHQAHAAARTLQNKGKDAVAIAHHNEETEMKPSKSLREFIETIAEAKTAKPVNVDKVNAAGQEPHEEKWEAAKKPAVKKESFTAEELLVALKEGLWPGTPEYKAKFDNKAKQGGGSGVKKGSRYGGSLQKPDDDNDSDDKKPETKKNK